MLNAQFEVERTYGIDEDITFDWLTQAGHTQKKGAPMEKINNIRTRTLNSEDVKKDNEEGECCPICLEEMSEGDVVRVLKCGHEIHQGCIDTWLSVNGCCPLCKAEVV